MTYRYLLIPLILLLTHSITSKQDDSIPPDEHAPDATQLLIQAGITDEEIANETSTEKESSTVVTARPRKLQLRRLATTTPKVCRKLSEEEKYKQLAGHGGMNQRFMATNSSQAGLFFKDSFPKKKSDLEEAGLISKIRVFPPATKIATIITESFSDGSVESCDAVCQSIVKTLNEAETSHRVSSPSSSPLRDSPKSRVLTAPIEKSEMRRGCGIDNAYFVAMDNCTKPGEEEDYGSGLVSLCTLCRGFYVFPADHCFPSILNSLHCGEEYGRKCIFDHFNTSHGECNEQTLVMKMLENRGDEECEDWKVPKRIFRLP
ncbi:hypothetical protein PFISCL1PPCAC_2542 [Pristionchus fissidentatus]|uniref:C3H1-type domain-containing protein n=1 Tax=Pristionchus fissidentatus TaxID=1538716 RepID=A0AAV5UYD4_9BILA|nr:hypothetical protein PFISCL1PPCAC_2542 [Pristionchus fissidentatus]